MIVECHQNRIIIRSWRLTRKSDLLLKIAEDYDAKQEGFVRRVVRYLHKLVRQVYASNRPPNKTVFIPRGILCAHMDELRKHYMQPKINPN